MKENCRIFCYQYLTSKNLEDRIQDNSAGKASMHRVGGVTRTLTHTGAETFCFLPLNIKAYSKALHHLERTTLKQYSINFYVVCKEYVLQKSEIQQT